jgi:hypothetical protein
MREEDVCIGVVGDTDHVRQSTMFLTSPQGGERFGGESAEKEIAVGLCHSRLLKASG